jgi:hypothetical protein
VHKADEFVVGVQIRICLGHEDVRS